MKKKLLDALKTKFSGVSEAILDRMATKKAEGVTDESQITAIVDGINFQDVLTSYGDFRANEANISSINNYEVKYGLKDGKPIEKGGEQRKDDKTTFSKEELDAYFEEKLKPFKEKAEQYDLEKKQGERLTLISSKMKELGLTDADMEFVTVPEGKDPGEFLTGYKQHLINKGLKPETAEGAQVSDVQANNTVAADWLSSAMVTAE